MIISYAQKKKKKHNDPKNWNEWIKNIVAISNSNFKVPILIKPTLLKRPIVVINNRLIKLFIKFVNNTDLIKTWSFESP